MIRPIALFSIAVAVAATTLAQQPADDPIARQLFPPELLMGHQEEIGLQEKQRATIRSEVVKLQGKVVDLQWQLSEEAQKMATLLRASPIDEARVLDAADKVMSLERDVKKMHLSMLVRIKNTLTPEQIAKLQEIRQKQK